MINKNDNSKAMVARAVNMLREMPSPYPMFAEMLLFFACIDYTKDKNVIEKMIINYLIGHLRGKNAQDYMTDLARKGKHR